MVDAEHIPVLLEEVMQYSVIDTEGVYVDATFGRGGHTKALLARLGQEARVIVIDRDPEAIICARKMAEQDERLTVEAGNFSDMKHCLLSYKEKVSSILMDLGVSSPQLSTPERGFSFLRDGPLDMRMDPEQGRTAEQWLNTAGESMIADVLFKYGQERYSRRIARSIVHHRNRVRISRTVQLADIVTRAIPRWPKGKHPATRSFQAIRIYINGELDALTSGLEQGFDLLKKGGRLLVIAFHSLEHQTVRRFIRNHAQNNEGYRCLRQLKKAIRPSEKAIASNPRARSARLIVIEKLEFIQ